MVGMHWQCRSNGTSGTSWGLTLEPMTLPLIVGSPVADLESRKACMPDILARSAVSSTCSGEDVSCAFSREFVALWLAQRLVADPDRKPRSMDSR